MKNKNPEISTKIGQNLGNTSLSLVIICLFCWLQDDVEASEEEEPMPTPGSSSNAVDNTVLAVTHENAFKWLYKDPQGSVQGTPQKLSPMPNFRKDFKKSSTF